MNVNKARGEHLHVYRMATTAVWWSNAISSTAVTYAFNGLEGEPNETVVVRLLVVPPARLWRSLRAKKPI
jgi:hypothetical protein